MNLFILINYYTAECRYVYILNNTQIINISYDFFVTKSFGLT